MASIFEISVPKSNSETALFWDALKERRFLLKRCRSCQRTHYYPRQHCPFCHSQETDWEPASGKGTIYSYTVMRREKPIRIVAYVELDEGVTILTNIVDCEPSEVRIGAEVKIVFRDVPGGHTLPMAALVLSQ